MELDGWEGEEDQVGVWKGENMIRIICTEKNIFQCKKVQQLEHSKCLSSQRALGDPTGKDIPLNEHEYCNWHRSVITSGPVRK